jgi:transposase
MSYRKVRQMELTEFIRRIKDGQSISRIAADTGNDRKTIRKYITKIKQEYSDLNLVTDQNLWMISNQTKKTSQKQDIFEPYLNEIETFLKDEKNPLKIKSVYEIIIKKHEITEAGSLSSFKRFIKSKDIKRNQKVTCHIERIPGAEIQVDYARVGKLKDTITGKWKTVYVLIGTLACSRHKYCEFVYKQDQKSFVESHVKMFKYFGGVPKIITLDNLKAGVIKADLYDPILNKTYFQMAEHYNCFLNTCRVAKPKDKPSVERDVQTIREEFKKLIIINPSVNIADANRFIREWIINEYGQRKHGSTAAKPYEIFLTIEHPLLQSLPEEEFEITQWKQAKVHPDCFIQVNKKSYSVPFEYIGKTLNINVKTRLIEIYYNEKLIKTHLIPKNNRQTDFDDFPENIQMATSQGLPAYLLNQAEAISGKNLQQFISKLLTPHAFINLRRAQAIIAVARKYDRLIVEEASLNALTELKCHHPNDFKKIILNLINRSPKAASAQINISEQTLKLIRPLTYYNHKLE